MIIFWYLAHWTAFLLMTVQQIKSEWHILYPQMRFMSTSLTMWKVQRERICQTLTCLNCHKSVLRQFFKAEICFFQVNLIHLPFFAATTFLRHLEKLSDLFEKLRVSRTSLTNKLRHLCQYLSSFVNRLWQLVSVCVPCRKWREELHLTRSWNSQSCCGITWETSRLPRWDALFFCFRTGCKQISFLHTPQIVCQEGDLFLVKSGKEGRMFCLSFKIFYNLCAET